MDVGYTWDINGTIAPLEICHHADHNCGSQHLPFGRTDDFVFLLAAYIAPLYTTRAIPGVS